MADSVFDSLGLGSVMLWSAPEFAVYWRVVLYLFPVLALVLTADQTASDRERGTLRFLALRASRDEIFFGRFIGFTINLLILILLTLLSIVIVLVWRDGSMQYDYLNSFFIISLNLWLVVMPFAALMALLSATVNSARQAILWAVLACILITGLLNALAKFWAPLEVLSVLIPGVQLKPLAGLAQREVFSLAHIPLIQTVVLLAGGRYVMSRRAL